VHYATGKNGQRERVKQVRRAPLLRECYVLKMRLKRATSKDDDVHS